MSILSFLLGRVTVSCAGERSHEVLSLCMRYGFVYGDLRTEDGRVYLSVSYRTARLLGAVCRRCEIPLCVERREGIGQVLGFCRSRPGIPVGICLAILLTVVASTHLWEIRVTGNGRLSAQEVERELKAAGLSLGDRLSEIDVDSIENRLLMNSEGISWISVNLIGTVAEVQVREKNPVTARETDPTPANLVARCDGVIASCEVLRGNLLVKVGDPVRAGEVLVSGLYDSAVLGYRYTRAAGEIYAETEHSFEITVPYDYERSVYTGESGRRVSLLFFGKTHPLYTSGDFPTDEENRFSRISYLSVFGKELPIGLLRESVRDAELREGRYTPDAAMNLAYDRLSREIAAIPGIRGLLEKSVTAEIGEDAYVLRCTVKCMENIAETKNIEINLFDP